MTTRLPWNGEDVSAIDCQDWPFKTWHMANARHQAPHTCACCRSQHGDLVPITNQPLRTLVNCWAASLDKRGEALPALKEAEYSEMLILASQTRGLLQAIEYAESTCVAFLFP